MLFNKTRQSNRHIFVKLSFSSIGQEKCFDLPCVHLQSLDFFFAMSAALRVLFPFTLQKTV